MQRLSLFYMIIENFNVNFVENLHNEAHTLVSHYFPFLVHCGTLRKSCPFFEMLKVFSG